jgi:penicillin-binding protein 1C
VFEVAHNRPSATIYWHLDDEYLGTTNNYHQMALSPAPGKHTLTLVDGKGHELEQEVKVLGE